jgi:hypothetical protein
MALKLPQRCAWINFKVERPDHMLVQASTSQKVVDSAVWKPGETENPTEQVRFPGYM